MTANGDEPRLLHQRSELGYTRSSSEALLAEPEAVPAEYQAELTARAHRDERTRLRRSWAETDSAITVALDRFADVVSPADGLSSSIRAVRRSAAALGRRIQA